MENELSELKELFSQISRERKSARNIKNLLTIGIVVVVTIFGFSFYRLFASFDIQNAGRIISERMMDLTPVITRAAGDMSRDVVPVYQEALRKEAAALVPYLEAKARKEANLFALHIEKETIPLFTDKMTEMFRKNEERIIREIPELADPDLVTKVFDNLQKYIAREASDIITTGLFSEQAACLREVNDALHGFKIRKSDESLSELSDRLFNLLGRIIEYEFFVEKVKGDLTHGK